MSETPTGASVARRSIGMELRKHRETAGVTVEFASKQAEISRQTLWKIEMGHPRVRIKNKDLDTLCRLYGTPDDVREALVNLAEITRVKGWYSSFADLLPPGFDMYIGLEEYATRIATYEIILVPGLLQTEDYARTMISSVPGRPESEIERRVEMRLRRQEILTRDGIRPAQLDVIINEAALCRQIGGPTVMAGQLRRINAVSELPNVSVRLLPFNAHSRIDVLAGPFVLLEFPGSGGPIAFVDGFTEAHGASYYDKPAEIARYESAFVDIAEAALGETESRGRIAQAAEEFESGGST